VCTGYVSDGDLIQLVRHAEASVFPSFYEGLGLPILESYAFGTPVLGADNSAIRELVLPELLFSAACPHALAAALGRLRADPGLRSRSLDFGAQVLGRIGWPTAARRIAECLRSAEPVAAATSVRILEPPARVAVVAAPGSDADARDDLAGPWAAGCGTDLFLPAAATPATSHRTARIYPIDVVRTVVTAARYRRAVFVLGAVADPVEQLLALRIGSGVERWVYVPGPNPAGLLATSLGARCPDPAAALRWLMEKGEITGFLVDDGACRARIVAALGGMTAGVRVELRHPAAVAA
jgi:hypothetical protein